ncbi:ABC transporter substrate-binding protein [Orrella sp. NBD-18]|uniref:ABC transporter substrate-binding protein n=1 Tax=Sheuella amnicola TaxID=2707330 RepID=A0A6B2R1U3_9BURK|nr:ABC transporter substrate-binding protein [Sheuella amnicola]NDY84068.1 ABC transporter substrate-binding protein [Sheuella amnicola]
MKGKSLFMGSLLSMSLAFSAGVVQAADPVTVGVAIPLSGPMALSGQNIKRSIDIAVDNINQKGGIKSLGGAPLKMIYADTTSDPSTGANVVSRMISNNRPVAIQGAYGSSITFAATGVSERQKIPFLTMSFSDDIINRGYKFVYQVVATASSMGKNQVEHTLELGKKAGAPPIQSIAVIFEDTAFGKSQADSVKKTAEAAGLKVVLFESYAPGLADAVPLVNKIVAAKAQALFINATISDSVLIIRGLRQQGDKTPIVAGGAGFLEPDFYKAIGAESEGIFVETPALAIGPLNEQYRAKYGTFMSHAGFEHAVITELIAEALEKTKSRSPTDLANALHEMTFKSGNAQYMPGGGVKFDARGANTMTYSIMAQWQNGELVPIWPQGPQTKPFLWEGKKIQ